jgi:streptogramin lyase
MKEKQYFIKQVVLVALFTVHCSLFTSPVRAQIGTWRNYLSYAEPQQIQAAGNDLFVMASGALYQYNQNDQSIYTYDKVNGMSDVDIKHIRWCKQAKRLVVVYSNSNIDLVETNGNITNISDLYTKTITGDKSVSSVRIDGIYAYLVCGFGIVKVNVQRAEIAETYTPSNPDYPTSLPAEDNSDYDKYIDVVKTLQPGGPKYNEFYESKFVNGKLYTTGGAFRSGQIGKNNPGIVQIWDGTNWTIYPTNINETTGFNYQDINCIDVDPTDNNHVAVAGRCGLYEFQNGILKKYHYKDNSPLRPITSSSTGQFFPNDYTLVHGIKYDDSGNLWVINSQATGANLMMLLKNGSWKTFTKEDLYDNKDVSKPAMRCITVDSRGYIWFVNTHFGNPSFHLYNPQTDQLTSYTSFTNQDGTSYNNCYPYDVKEDHSGNIWIATNQGPFYIKSDDVGKDKATLYQEKVPRNDGTDYADYLLTGIHINTIVIDGAGRKWFGTRGNGVYLISADNMTQIHHFTADNSKLLSDNILYMSINSTSGEVFFLTDEGLCSYISDATEPNEEMTKDNVWAYPNPVTPDYTGPITITGLSYDADVKILAANGALIHQGRSNGGTYTWDGCDQQGRRVASGIYMVATATSDGKKGIVCKIAIVR